MSAVYPEPSMRTRSAIVLVWLAVTTPALSQTPGSGAELTRPPVSESADEDEAAEDWVTTGASKLAVAAPPYPREVRRSLTYGRKLCREEGGTALTYPKGIVRTGDLTGDGRPDYVIDYRGSMCTERPYMFNGTGGWDFEVLVATGSGRLASVFSGRIRDYDISQGPGTRTMTFSLHGGYCGLGGAEECIRKRRIDGRRFAFRDR
jgi:hypothetical protein